ISDCRAPYAGNTTRLRVTASEQDLRRVSQRSKREGFGDNTKKPLLRQPGVLRLRNSAPVLSVANPKTCLERPDQGSRTETSEGDSDVFTTDDNSTKSKAPRTGSVAMANDNSP